ncbi:MAG TPA: hypothetical protein VKZ79_01430 [Alphaproteobacteria bacterium]|nr:hypothetical protein [Alphaproteobacteria bacterium]
MTRNRSAWAISALFAAGAMAANAQEPTQLTNAEMDGIAAGTYVTAEGTAQADGTLASTSANVVAASTEAGREAFDFGEVSAVALSNSQGSARATLTLSVTFP